jgi:galactofuranose transport system permease protein
MAQLTKLWKKINGSGLLWTFVALFLMLLINLIINPQFFSLQVKDGHLYGSLVDILNNGAPLMVVAVGMTLVIATGGTDLSVGPVIAITGAIATSLIGVQNGVTAMPMPLVILISLSVATMFGLWNGLLVSRVGVAPIVATLILMVAGRGIAQMITNGKIVRIFYDPYFFFGSQGYMLIPFSLVIVAIVYLIAWLFLRRTAFGMFLEAIGVNTNSSRFSGINSKNVILIAYAISGLCAGIAGILVSSNMHSADGNNAGLYYELDAILSVALGGTALAGGRFSLAGSFLGALIIQSLTTSIYSMGVPPQYTLVVKAIVVLVVSLLQSEKFRHNVQSRLQFRKENAA